jgi:hypothetical protein
MKAFKKSALLILKLALDCLNFILKFLLIKNEARPTLSACVGKPLLELPLKLLFAPYSSWT